MAFASVSQAPTSLILDQTRQKYATADVICSLDNRRWGNSHDAIALGVLWRASKLIPDVVMIAPFTVVIVLTS